MSDQLDVPRPTVHDEVVHTVTLDLASRLAQPDRCPSCGAGALTPGKEASGVVFTCRACRGRWLPEAGRLRVSERAGDPGIAGEAGTRTAAHVPAQRDSPCVSD